MSLFFYFIIFYFLSYATIHQLGDLKDIPFSFKKLSFLYALNMSFFAALVVRDEAKHDSLKNQRDPTIFLCILAVLIVLHFLQKSMSDTYEKIPSSILIAPAT